MIGKTLKRIKHVYRLTVDAEYRELNRIAKIPSQSTFSTRLLGSDLQVLDAPGFLFLYTELFTKQLYDFGPDTDAPFIIDGGANIGLSIIYFKTKWKQAKIIGFEPDPDVHAVCIKNLKSFGFENVQVLQKALYEHEGAITFSKGKNDEGRITLGHAEREITVETVKLSSFMYEPIDFLKLDIEGSETSVITECYDRLHLVRKIFIEYHSYEGEPQTLQIILQLLSKAGFRYFISTPYEVIKMPYVQKVPPGKLMGVLNIMGIRE